jgi:hypothetical protein
MKLQGKINFAFTIAIEDIEIIRSEPALGVLNGLAAKIEGVLMATEAECRRLGFIS